MNSQEYAKYGISADELSALQGKAEVEKTPTFSQREKIAVKYARLISESPLSFSQSFIDILKENFTEREIVILAGTAAQVNYWARFLQALGVPPAGFTSNCRI